MTPPVQMYSNYDYNARPHDQEVPSKSVAGPSNLKEGVEMGYNYTDVPMGYPVDLQSAPTAPPGPLSTPRPPPAQTPARTPAAVTSSTRSRNMTKNDWCCCCCCVLPLFIAFVLVGIASLEYISHSFFEFNDAHYAVDMVSITGLEPSALNASGSTGIVNIEISFRLQASNHGKSIRFFYYDIQVTFETLGLMIGYTQLAPFDLGHRSTKYIPGDVKSGPLYLSIVSQAGVIAANESGYVPLTMKVFARVRRAFKVLGLTTKQDAETIRLHKNMNVNTSSNTAGGP